MNRITSELAGSDYSAICTSLENCALEMFEKREGYQLIAQNDLLRALVLILRSCDILGKPKRQLGSVNGIALALDHIDENFLGEITIPELCEVARMGRSNFERLFVMIAGVPVREYVKRRRIDHAAELLRTTNQTVLAIALASGYHNTANFNKQFRSVTGVTPQEYKRNVKDM